MNITGIFSAIGNNNTIIPLAIKDSLIENPIRVGMGYKQGSKVSKSFGVNESKERAVEEYGTSLVWLGGIPLIEKACNKAFKKFFNLNLDVDAKLLDKSGEQGLQENIDKFENTAKEAIEDLKKVAENKNLFKKLCGVKFLAATFLPITLMGFVLPKLNYAYTNKRLKAENSNSQSFKGINQNQKNIFKNFLKPNSNISFKGGLSSFATVNTVTKMKYLDYGLAAGRVSTGRNLQEMAENAFKMAGMIYIIYGAPKQLQSGLETLLGKIFKTDISLDNKIIENEEFKNILKDGSFKNIQQIDSNKVIDFIDKNPENFFVKSAKDLNLVKFLKNNIRDPRKLVNTKEVLKLNEVIENFAQKAAKSDNIEKFIKKTSIIKRFSILANLCISCTLMAYVLPKAQYAFRKLITGSDASPGIKELKSQIN